MSAERLKDLLAHAVGLPPDEQRDLIARTIAADAGLGSELASLLEAHTRAGTFLATPAHITLASLVSPATMSIGAYRTTRLIGRGGMGDVYEAETDPGASGPRVALKIMRRGIASPEVVRRFAIERRSLARLEHPNIARLLDGGAGEDGTPYLVMEFVEGERIDVYCDHHQLIIDDRLKLFLCVCDAVQYAHSRLIVHRDLKPDNILVTPDGTPKLLDFGIAKLLAVTDEAAPLEQTRPDVHLFTPEYASPEQSEGREITTASDVYSLGVLLYVLLTGQHPFPHAHPPSTAAVSELDPRRPGSREIRTASPEGADRTRKRLKGDLDTIIMTALEREPEKRYISVEQFAEDIRRHLDHLPILARPAPVIRRLGKFIRRNRVLAGVMAAIALGLITGLFLLIHQVREAREEQARIERLNAFLTTMLSYSNPTQPVNGSSRTVTVMQEMLDDAARRLESEEFTDQPDLRIRLERILGDAYIHQGRYDEMYEHYRKYIQLRSEHPGIKEPERVETQVLWAIELFAKGKLPESEDLFRRSLPAMRTAYGKGEVTADIYADALNNFAYLRRTQGDSREAEALFREVVGLGPAFPPNRQFIVSVSRATLASVLADQGRFHEAVATAREAVEESHRAGMDSTSEYGFVLTVYGGLLTDAGRYPEADTLLTTANIILHRYLPPENLWTADNVRDQAWLYYRKGEYARAFGCAQEAAQTYRQRFGAHYDNYPTALSIKGLSLARLGRSTEADQALREAVRLRHELMPPGHFFTAMATGALGEFLTGQRRFAEAESLLVTSHADLHRALGNDDPRTAMARTRLHDLYTAWKHPAQAEQYR